MTEWLGHIPIHLELYFEKANWDYSNVNIHLRTKIPPWWEKPSGNLTNISTYCLCFSHTFFSLRFWAPSGLLKAKHWLQRENCISLFLFFCSYLSLVAMLNWSSDSIVYSGLLQLQAPVLFPNHSSSQCCMALTCFLLTQPTQYTFQETVWCSWMAFKIDPICLYFRCGLQYAAPIIARRKLRMA